MNCLATIRKIQCLSLIWLGWIVLVCPNTAWAQYRATLGPNEQLKHLSIDHWDNNNGLPGNTLHKVAQTPDGYLWLASPEGLIRFDGVSFKTYSKQTRKEFSSNQILDIATGADSTLWIASNRGLISYRRGQFETHGDSAVAIQCLKVNQKSKAVWVGFRNNGLKKYLWKTKEWISIIHPLLANRSVLDIEQEVNARVWAIISNLRDSTTLLSCEDGSCQPYTLSDTEGLLTPTCLKVLKTGRILVGTNRGIYVRTAIGGFKKLEQLPEIETQSIAVDYSDNTWVSSTQGLLRLPPKYANRSVEVEWMQTLEGNRILGINHSYQGLEGSIWVASAHAGLFRIKDSNFRNFHHTSKGVIRLPISAIGYFDKGKPLAGNTRGELFTIEDGSLTPFAQDQPYALGRVNQIIADDHSEVWIGADNGLLNYHTQTEEFKFYSHNSFYNGSLQVKSLLKGNNGNIWVGTCNNGLLQLDSSHRLSMHYSEKIGNFPSNSINSIKESTEGTLTIGTKEAGVVLLEPSTQAWTQWSTQEGLCNNTIFSTHTDLDGVIWAVTPEGIGRIDRMGKAVNFTHRQGMPNEAAYDFIEDVLSNIWLPCSQGIMFINKESLNRYASDHTPASDSLEWELFTREDGISYAQCTPNAFSWVDGQNNLWIPNVGGLTQITPHQMAYNAFTPPVYLEKFVVSGKELPLNQRHVITRASQRYTFAYTALSLWAPSKIKFKYMLEGHDEDWIEAKDERLATYTNLTPGDYVFKVIASNNDNVWNTKGAKLSFTIRPHFYEHPVFLFGITLAAFFILRALYNWRLLREKLQTEALEKRVKDRTREIATQRNEIKQQHELLRMKQRRIEQQKNQLESSKKKLEDLNHELEEKVALRTQELETRSQELEEAMERLVASNNELNNFLYQAPHDFRGPIARMLGILQIANLESKANPSPYLERLHEVANSMDLMLKKLLQIYSLAKRKPTLEQVHIKEVYEESLKHLSERFELENYQLFFEDNNIDILFTDRELIGVILENLLENALYYTRVKPAKEREIRVTLSLNDKESQVSLTVSDNGAGIPKKLQKEIFKAFFKASEISLGNGLGLYLVSKCAEILRGEISLSSNLDEGCSVSIELKTIFSYYSSSQ